MDDYEGKFLYRLVKVAYSICLLIGIIFSLGMAWNSRPTQVFDSEKSTVVCDNGKNYSVDKTGVYIFDTKASLSKDDVVELKKLCLYGFVNNYSNEYDKLITPDQINYKFSVKTKTEGGWPTAIGWAVLGSLIVYIILNIARETLNYLLIGKPFDWIWLSTMIIMFFHDDPQG